MGWDPLATTVVGIKFSGKEIIKSVNAKTFSHNYPESVKFCSQTGKPLWQKVIRFVDGSECWDRKIADLDVVTADETISENTSELFVGEVVKADQTESKFIAGKNLQSMKKKIQEKLEPLGLWHESRFGIYTLITGG